MDLAERIGSFQFLIRDREPDVKRQAAIVLARHEPGEPWAMAPDCPDS